FGQIELHVNAHALGVYDSFVGLKLLQPPFALGSFQSIQVMIPDWIFNKLKSTTYSDLTFKYLISLPAGNGGIYFDNMRFGTTPTTWPNAVSSAASDSWLAVNHANIQKLQPRVLVLNFDNSRDNAAVTPYINAEVAGLK